MASITLTPPGSSDPDSPPRRERILAFGPPGAGKSYCWQRILASTPDEVQFHVIDTDGAWEPARDSDEFAPFAHRVHHTEPYDWTDYVEGMKTALKMMDRERGDWLVIDMADDAWSSAQDFYSDRRYSGDSDSIEFFEALVDGTLDDDNEDAMAKWGTINKLYAPFRRTIIRVPGNIFIATTAKEMKRDKQGNFFREGRQDVKDFGSLGYKPAGQKNLSHDVNTVLYLPGKKGGRRQIHMVKDRNREHAWESDEMALGDFARDVLMGVAEWEPGVSG